MITGEASKSLKVPGVTLHQCDLLIFRFYVAGACLSTIIMIIVSFFTVFSVVCINVCLRVGVKGNSENTENSIHDGTLVDLY